MVGPGDLCEFTGLSGSLLTTGRHYIIDRIVSRVNRTRACRECGYDDDLAVVPRGVRIPPPYEGFCPRHWRLLSAANAEKIDA